MNKLLAVAKLGAIIAVSPYVFIVETVVGGVKATNNIVTDVVRQRKFRNDLKNGAIAEEA